MSRMGNLTAILIAGVALSCADAGVEPAASEQVVTTFLPAGDHTAGREAFGLFQCNACHRVAGDPGLPATVAAPAGPVLGPAQAALSQGEIVSAIVLPSHGGPAPAGDGALSPMGDHTQVMTVRQLVDLVAYLEMVAQP